MPTSVTRKVEVVCGHTRARADTHAHTHARTHTRTRTRAHAHTYILQGGKEK